MLANICKAQNYQYIYYLDEHQSSTSKAKALVIGKGLKEDGLFRLDYFAKWSGKLFMSAHFIDSSIRIMQGKFTEFHSNGKIESEGDFVNDKKNGLWQKWDSGLKTDSTMYQDGNVYTEMHFAYHKNRIMSYYTNKDSLADTYRTFSYNDKGILTSEVYFKGQQGILKRYDSGQIKTDSLFTRVEREASFPGGQAGWIGYLQKNLDADIPVRSGAPAGTYQVIVKFIVSKDGSISSVIAETKHGYGMEKEVIRIIEKGPAWIPAIQYGRKLNAYRRQPVTFVVQVR